MFKDAASPSVQGTFEPNACFASERIHAPEAAPLWDRSPTANHNNLVRAMRRHPVFANLTYSQFQSALTASHAEDFDAGTVLYERGATARHFFIVVEGRVNLSLFSRAGAEKVIEILGP